jgi:hypothetical protein
MAMQCQTSLPAQLLPLRAPLPLLARLLLAVIIWLAASLATAWAKNSVWLDDTTELRYSKGHYKADGRHGNGIDIDISDVDIFEKGIQRGFAEQLTLKTDGLADDIVAIENLLIRNFSYASDKQEVITIAFMSGQHLMLVDDNRIEAYRQRHNGNRPLRSQAEIRDISVYSERDNLEIQIAGITLDGLLTSAQFDALPDSTRSQLALNGLVLRQMPGGRFPGEIDAFFAILGSDELGIDITLDFDSRKTGDSLQILGKLALSATSLADITTDFQMDLTRNDYQALSQMTQYLVQTPNPAAQQAVGMALLASLSSLSVDITDKGMLDLFTRIQGDQGINIAILMMQVSLSEAIPRHALAISTPIAAFLQQGGALALRTQIAPRLSPAEILALQFDPEQLIERTRLELHHTPE